MSNGNYLIKNKFVAIADSDMVEGEKALVAQKDLPKNEIIFLYEAPSTKERTRTSIQVSHDRHVEPGDFGAFANHSCSPNTQLIANFDDETFVAQVLLLAICPIKKGEEIVFDYATTESEVTKELQGKKCLCNAQNCRKTILGFNDLELTQKQILLLEGITASYLRIK